MLHLKMHKTQDTNMTTNNFKSRRLGLLWFTFVSIAFAFSAKGQLPEVGKIIPDFTLNDITHFKRSTATANDLRGKWLFLDFWSINCLSCIQSFSKVSSYHHEFKDKLNWIMVGINTKHNKGIREFYEKIRQKQNLEMPVAYDSVLEKKWKVNAVPYIIIVDPKGVVRGITHGGDVNSAAINKLIKGEEISFVNVSTSVNPPILSATDSVKAIVYYSKLTKSTGEKSSGGSPIDRWIKWPESAKIKGYNFLGVPLFWLYNHAYWGKTFWDYDDPDYSIIYTEPIVEIKDPSMFKYDGGKKGLFDYNLVLPVTNLTKEEVMKTMQEDLERVFKYEASIETRSIPVWKLVAEPGAIDKLKTKGGEKYSTPGVHILGFTIRNWPAYYLVGCISYYVQEKFDHPRVPFIDATGMTENFDLTLEADMANIDDIKRALKKQGLDLVRGTHEMKALVIRDPIVH